MATLYELTESAKALYELLANEEIDEQTVNDTLEAMGVDEKIENYCKLIRQFEADAEVYKAEETRLYNKRKTTENAIKRLKETIVRYMEQTDNKKVKAGTFDVGLSSSQSVNITDINKIPAGLLLPTEPKANKTAIKKMILEGAEIEGAEIVTNKGVRIR